RGRAMSPRQALVAVVAIVIASVGVITLLTGRTVCALVSLEALQLLAIAVTRLMMGGLPYRLEYGFSSFPGKPSVEPLPGRAQAPLGLGAVRYYARSNGERQSELVHQLVLNRSLDGRDILAYQATKGRLSFDGIRSLLEAFRTPSKRGKVRRLAKSFHRESLLWLARTLYRQDAAAADRINAIALYELVEMAFSRHALSPSDREWLVSALVREGHPA